jgi:phage gp46-like protein
LSRATLDACEKRRDQAERRKFKFFHKLLRLLNITKVSSLQALTETRSKLFSHWTDYSPRISVGSGRWIVRRKKQHASCNRQSEIYTLKSSGVLAQLVERLNGIAIRVIFSHYPDLI